MRRDEANTAVLSDCPQFKVSDAMDLMPQIREIFTFEKVVPLEMIFCF